MTVAQSRFASSVASGVVGRWVTWESSWTLGCEFVKLCSLWGVHVTLLAQLRCRQVEPGNHDHRWQGETAGNPAKHQCQSSLEKPGIAWNCSRGPARAKSAPEEAMEKPTAGVGQIWCTLTLAPGFGGWPL